MPSNDLPRSLPLLLHDRMHGRYQILQVARTGSFAKDLSRQFAGKKLVQDPQIVTPQTNARHHGSIGISSIHVDRVEDRFLLVGGDDATVSIYDLSKWGSEEFLDASNRKRNNNAGSNVSSSFSMHKPVARSRRELPRMFSEMSSVEIPKGHASPVSQVQWYPVDSGAFLSSAKDGTLLIWDTNSLSPVAQCRPFQGNGICSFHLSPLRNYSTVVGSLNDPAIKLVDIRTGASSHSLLGHGQQGISSLQWAPHNEVILASGGLDGTVRLWDIRKAGSRACVAILNQDVTQSPLVINAYKFDYSHLPKPAATQDIDTITASSTAATLHRASNLKKKVTTTVNVAPNNFRAAESSAVVSHAGSVSAISFGFNGHYLVSTGQDGALHVWDLRTNGCMLPLRFFGPGQQPAVSRQKKQVPLLITWDDTSLGKCWVGNGNSIMGFDLERGGAPSQLLEGHLQNISAIDTIESSNLLLTGGKDGMVLTWGKPRQKQLQRKADDRDNW